jgi:hypothetical protein
MVEAAWALLRWRTEKNRVLHREFRSTVGERANLLGPRKAGKGIAPPTTAS